MRMPDPTHPLAALALATLATAAATLTLPEGAHAQRMPAPAAGELELRVLGDSERRDAARLVRGTDRKRAARRRVGRGPFHPVVGKPDYGSGDAGFGAARSGHVHAGQDVFAPAGTPLVAVADGLVVEVGSDGGRGNHVAIYDGERNRTYAYFHLNAPAEVKGGERVQAGERIGAVGCSGSCWGDHLHFEVRTGKDPYGKAVDPLPILEGWQALERPRRQG